MLVTIPTQYAVRPGIRIQKAWLPQIEKICKRFNVRVSSGFRAKSINSIVGGAKNSDHLNGDAADFVPFKQNLWNWANGKYPYVEPTSITTTHVHISFQHGATTVSGVTSGDSFGDSTTVDPTATLDGLSSNCLVMLFLKFGVIIGVIEGVHLILH